MDARLCILAVLLVLPAQARAERSRPALAPRLELVLAPAEASLCRAGRCRVLGKAHTHELVARVLGSARPARFRGAISDRYHLVLEHGARRYATLIGEYSRVYSDQDGEGPQHSFALVDVRASELGGLPVVRVRFRDTSESASVAVVYCALSAGAPTCLGPVWDADPVVLGRGRVLVNDQELRF